MLTLGHQSAGDRLRTIDRAEIVIFVHAAHIVSEVVENVVAGMGKDQTQGKRNPG